MNWHGPKRINRTSTILTFTNAPSFCHLYFYDVRNKGSVTDEGSVPLYTNAMCVGGCARMPTHTQKPVLLLLVWHLKAVHTIFLSLLLIKKLITRNLQSTKEFITTIGKSRKYLFYDTLVSGFENSRILLRSSTH
jgi:hypothetical protein